MKLIDDLKGKVPETLPAGKSLTTYKILAILLGGLGIHNLWAGEEAFKIKGQAQLKLGLCSICCCLFCIPGLLSWITALQDAFSVKEAVPAA